jgi:hypothetical protein
VTPKCFCSSEVVPFVSAPVSSGLHGHCPETGLHFWLTAPTSWQSHIKHPVLLFGNIKSIEELSCDKNTGACTCLDSREGRRCEACTLGFYLPPNNKTGCLICDCHEVGAVSQKCNPVSGQCPCKPEETGAETNGTTSDEQKHLGVTGRRCDQCAPTYWNFHQLFGTCEPCNCNEAGSNSPACNTNTGQCDCKANVIGKQCDTCKPGSSFLRASNPMGCYSHPEQLASPTTLNITARWVTMTWDPPDHPNGEQLTYKLFRDDDKIYEMNATA